MATISLKEGYRIKSDSRQWIFQKQGSDDQEGNEVWSNIGYYSSIKPLVNACYGYFLRKSDADSINDFMDDARAEFNSLVDSLSPIAEIAEKQLNEGK